MKRSRLVLLIFPLVPLAVSQMKDTDKRRSATEVLERVGLKDRLLHLPQQLSGSEQERVAIARACA